MASIKDLDYITLEVIWAVGTFADKHPQFSLREPYQAELTKILIESNNELVDRDNRNWENK